MVQTKTKNAGSQTHTYPPESAGRIMAENVPATHESATVSDIEQLLFKNAGEYETVNYIYLLDGHGKLTGVVSMKDLLRAKKSQPAKELSPEKLITARTHTDQERVALLAIEHSIKAIPVVDPSGKFLGVVPPDTILQVLHSENVEDALRLAGAGKIDNPAVGIIKAGARLHFRKRLPWLIIGLLGGILAAFVVRLFEGALAEQLALAAFIPAVVYMADAVGAQTQTIFVRSMALTHTLDMKAYVLREFRVNLALAVILSFLIAAFSLVWLGSPILSLVLGISIMITVLAAMGVAIAMPWIFLKLRYDPAIASGPFATVVRDITSLLIYFGVASLFL